MTVLVDTTKVQLKPYDFEVKNEKGEVIIKGETVINNEQRVGNVIALDVHLQGLGKTGRYSLKIADSENPSVFIETSFLVIDPEQKKTEIMVEGAYHHYC